MEQSLGAVFRQTYQMEQSLGAVFIQTYHVFFPSKAF